METLVLNAGFEPVARVPWQRAITLIFDGKVEVLESYDDRPVRSVTVQLAMPSVVRFVRQVRRGRRGVKFSRDNVYARDRGRCQYCGTRLARDSFTFDHVVPRSKGGHTRFENIVTSCVPCNQRKSHRTPAEAGMRLLAVPVRPKSIHDAVRITFAWNRGMPPSWRTWLIDAVYWHGALESD